MSTQVLLVKCNDRRGLVHAITGVFLNHGVNVVGIPRSARCPRRAFKQETLVFNKTDKTVVKKITVKEVPTEITLAPFQFCWIKRL